MNERDDPTKAGLTAIIDIAKPLGIAVHDHIIVGRGGHASLKGMKLI
jgi:DNA repair protein RadC